ncbi:hypothetical protein PENTCL1PPCAC_26478, partial [Pristionchus entomophagus]
EPPSSSSSKWKFNMEGSAKMLRRLVVDESPASTAMMNMALDSAVAVIEGKDEEVVQARLEESYQTLAEYAPMSTDTTRQTTMYLMSSLLTGFTEAINHMKRHPGVPFPTHSEDHEDPLHERGEEQEMERDPIDMERYGGQMEDIDEEEEVVVEGEGEGETVPEMAGEEEIEDVDVTDPMYEEEERLP